MDLRGSWQYIIETAKSRLAHNKTAFHVDEYGTGIEVIGVAGEIVARRYLGLDEGVHLGFDGGADIIYYGQRIDVKATMLTPKVEFKFLQWSEWKPIKSDIILLTVIDPIEMIGYPVGYATRDEMLRAPINETRHIPCHEIAIHDLHPMWELGAFGKKAAEQRKRGVSQAFAYCR
jgi:hypothetical protein